MCLIVLVVQNIYIIFRIASSRWKIVLFGDAYITKLQSYSFMPIALLLCISYSYSKQLYVYFYKIQVRFSDLVKKMQMQ